MGPTEFMGIAVVGLASLCGVLAVALANVRVERDALAAKLAAELKARRVEKAFFVGAVEELAALEQDAVRMCECHGRHGV